MKEMPRHPGCDELTIKEGESETDETYLGN